MHVLIRRTPVVFVLGVVLAGCGGEDDGLPREAVSGTVTFKGQPLDLGSISFRPEGPSVLAEGLIENGSYAISRDKGLVPGKYKVLISARAGPEPTRDMTVPPGPVTRPKRRPADLIPPRYNSASKLTADVTAGGKNVFDFDLK
jgi:hypothetical protein